MRVQPLFCARRLWFGVGLFLFLGGAPDAPAQSHDPVEDLKAALPSSLDDDRAPAVLKYREENLKKKVEALQTLGQMRRALELTEWKDLETGQENTAAIDRVIRNLIGERLKDGLEVAAAKQDASGRIAVATLIGEMGTSVRSLSPKEMGGYARTLTPLVLKLARDPDPAVRDAALKALGKINANLADGTEPLQTALSKDEVPVRRTAAATLAQLIRTSSDLQKRGRSQSGVESTAVELLETSRLVVQMASLGFADADPLVREGCMESLFLASRAMAQMVPPPYEPGKLPNDGRPRTAADEKMIAMAHMFLKEERTLLEPLLSVIAKQGEKLATGLSDPNPQVRLKARLSLEEIALARYKVLKREASVPPLEGGGFKEKEKLESTRRASEVSFQGDKKGDLYWEALGPSFDYVVKNHLNDPNVDVRRAGIYFIELLEEKAAPAVPALVPLLDDSDLFVRWSAARALGRIGPVQTDVTVPALAKLLFDNDLEVRRSAAQTLGSYGRVAKQAVPQLTQAIGRGDAIPREAAIFALRGIGPDAASAIPALIDVLNNPEARVRRAAIEVLGYFGPRARDAAGALRRCLNDDDEEVRRVAADALLQVLANTKN